MKKIIYILVLTIIMTTLVSCKSNDPIVEPDKPSVSTDNTQSQDNSDPNETKDPQNNSSTTQNTKTTQVPGKEIYIDYDSSFRKKDEAYTIVLYNTNDALVGLSFKKEITFTGDVSEVIDLFKNDFINDASLSSRGDLYGSTMEVVNSEKVNIAGFESSKFTAKVLNKQSWECHIYGYSFIIDGTPCAIIGLVSAENQSQDIISSIDKAVDTIASTIRTHK